MRLTPGFLVFFTLLTFGPNTSNGFAQANEATLDSLRGTYGEDLTKLIRPRAEKGDAQAQFDLGFLYLFHDADSNLAVDHAKGMEWVRKSAAQGNARAQDLIGCLHYHGKILVKDEAEAVKWFQKAAAQGDVYAQFNLGYCFYKGEGVAKDVGEAVRLFRLAAEQGEETAQHNLARILESGEGVPKDYAEASKWFFNLALQAESVLPKYRMSDRPRSARDLNSAKEKPASAWRKAADAGDAQAQYELGFCHENGVGVEPDKVEAMKWFRRSAQGGYAPAQFLLGFFHQEGHRLEYDHDEILRWYGKAADQGYAKAQFNLGCYYDDGQDKSGKVVAGGTVVWTITGIPKNPVEALKWYSRAAENGHAQAQYLMGNIHHSGEGVQKDHAQSVKWWIKAAELGDSASQFKLGVMYFHGRGTDKNFAESTKWFRKCAMQKPAIFYCGVGRRVPLPMVVGIQSELITPRNGPE